jgi:hypothetical protein
VRRYSAQLVEQEDRIDQLRRDAANLDRVRNERMLELQELVEQLALDIVINGGVAGKE